MSEARATIRSRTGRVVSYLLACAQPSRRFLLILAHMRSGSTLLAHLLMGNPTVLGGGEQNQAYRNKADLDRLAMRLQLERRRLFRKHDLVIDQINHDRFVADSGLLNEANVWKLFLIREPVGAISSLIRLHRDHYSYLDWSLEEATEYYVRRLQTLRRHAAEIQDPATCFYVDYDQLVTQPRPTLDRLQQFLNLQMPLSQTYPTHPFTGRRGDPSPNIQEGRIVSGETTPVDDLDSATIARLQQEYDACARVLQTLSVAR